VRVNVPLTADRGTGWLPEMDEFINRIATVSDVGSWVGLDCCEWDFRARWLTLVEPAE
jgi:hypothetical protein